MKRVLAALLLLLVGSAHAGFYAVMTSTTDGSKASRVGVPSSCMMTVGMAIGNAYGINSGTVTAIDTAAGSWNYTYSSFSAVGTYGPCQSNALSSSSPTYTGGVSDPGINSDGAINGGGSGGGACVSNLITSATDAQTISMALVGLLAVGFSVRAIRHALQSADGSDEKF